MLPCKDCFAPNNQSCVSCISSYLLLGSTCVDKCPPKFFDNDGYCAECDPRCNNCTEAMSNCVNGCDTKYYLLNINSCLESCPKGYAANLERVCVKCEEETKVCVYESLTKKTISKECMEGFFLFEGNCLKICKYGYYANESSRTCQKCDIACSVLSHFLYLIKTTNYF